MLGFDGWSYRVDELHPTTTTLGIIMYRATVTVEALGVRRTDVGVGIVAPNRDGEDTPEAHETAIKGAATDALKRAFRSFGAQFGNDLYDKGRDTEPASTLAAKPAETKAGEKTVGDLLTWARRDHGLTRAQVLDIVGVKDAREITDLKLATSAVQAYIANAEASK